MSSQASSTKHESTSTSSKAPASTTSSSSSKAPATNTSSSSQSSASTSASQTTKAQQVQVNHHQRLHQLITTKVLLTQMVPAMNQKGPWDGQSTTADDFGRSQAEQTWLENHPGAKMTGQTYADNSTTQTPVYSGDENDPYENAQRPQMTQQQLQDANQAMQKNINTSQTFGNGIQWVSSNYKGEVVGTQSATVDNPVNTPYENYANHTGQIDANVVKQMYGSETGVHVGDGSYKAPADAHYVSSNITNAGQNGGPDKISANNVNLTFYK